MSDSIDPAAKVEETTLAGKTRLGAGINDEVERVPLIGVDDAGSMFIMHNGAAASYFKGEWQPGIIFEGRDLMNFNPITEQGEVDTLMKQAAKAMQEFLDQHES